MKNVKSLALVALLSSTVPFLTVGCGDVVDNNSTTNTGGSTNNGGNGNNGSTNNGNGNTGGEQQGSGGNEFDLSNLDSINQATCTELATTSITTDTTWTTGCYRATSDIRVYDRALLTIEPGTVIFFDSGAGLRIDSAMKAVSSSPSTPIIFTSTQKTAGHWDGINIYGATDNRNEMANVVIEYANIGLEVDGADSHVNIKNSTIQHSKTYGFSFDGGTVVDGFENVTSTDNKVAGFVYANVLSGLDEVSDFTGNTNDYIEVHGASITTDQTWRDLTVPAFLTTDIRVYDGALLTINPGASFLCDANFGLRIDSAIKAVGTSSVTGSDPTGSTISSTTVSSTAKPITFTGAQETAGYWDGINIYGANDTRTELANVVIKYAKTGLLVDGADSRLKIRNSTIQYSKNYGFKFEGGAIIDQFQNVTSTNNKIPGYVYANELSALDEVSNFTGNTNDYIEVHGDSITTDQTWRDLTVPAFLTTDTRVYDGALLTINPGASFLCDTNYGLRIDSAIKAIGTAKDPINFTGKQSTSGYWSGINLYGANDTRNEIAYTTIDSAGAGYAGAVLVDGYNSKLNIHDSTISNSSSFGLWIGGTATVTNTHNTFRNNTDGDVHQD